ncbi:WD40/YVTN/BNR-like repeat-containing protein [Aliikangiella coralliicola]|uniref:Exo-alpha-sialidase n=1 Tax=Aliikangiella coralliicola TaxID=2592383 RepID=A0A545UIR5_9GAMM|nr:exo-alpha-sialidase [Aliikangiella coralliicola]TQV89355.1 exo-alpha-sialidase [Aliikangiella coralliicola]
MNNPSSTASNDTLALIATRKGLFRLDNNKQIHLVDFIGVPVSMVLSSATHSHWYAALDHGHFGVKLHRSDNFGESWQEVSAPSYPQTETEDTESSDEATGETAKGETAKGDSLELIWSLAYANSDNPKALWAGTIPGGLFLSEDGGESWQFNESLWQYKQEQGWFGGGFDQAGIHSICVHPTDPQQVKIAVSCAGVWETQDSGKSWATKSKGMRAAYMPPEQQFEPSIQDPHLVVQCQSSPEFLWTQHHNGIFRSTDNAENWQEITEVKPSVFGFTVAVHPDDGNTAWFVPAVKDECRVPVDNQLVVTRTRDGGETFEALTNGLPQVNAYDLVFRHGLDIDTTGNQLLMGSTTGNLWLSDDQGDNWQCLSSNLPPIYAVQFIK